MDETAARLIDGLRLAAGLDGTTTAISKALGVSTAVVTNWKQRGVSRDGLLLAHKRFGISPTWVETGRGSWNGASVVQEITGRYEVNRPLEAQDVVAAFAALLDQLPDSKREEAARRIDTLIKAPDSARAREAVAEILGTTATPQAPPKPRDVANG